MGIGKGKSDSIDIDGLMERIDNENKVAQEESRLDEKITELQQATAEFNTAIDRLDSIVTNFNKTLEEIRTNGFGARVHPQTMKSLSEICTNFVVEVGRQLIAHRDKQLELQKEHERRTARMLEKGNSIWLSDKWMKILFITLFLVSIVQLISNIWL